MFDDFNVAEHHRGQRNAEQLVEDIARLGVPHDSLAILLMVLTAKAHALEGFERRGFVAVIDRFVQLLQRELDGGASVQDAAKAARDELAKDW